MKTIQTRFLDIPFEEAAACAAPGDGLTPENWESAYRGKPVRIEVPAIKEARFFTCQGPFFRLADRPSAAVCPHIAEIGD